MKSGDSTGPTFAAATRGFSMTFIIRGNRHLAPRRDDHLVLAMPRR